MSSPIQMTEDQFQQLLNAVMQTGGTTQVTGRTGSFSNCSTRFDGKRNYNEVEAFITKINIYKTIEKISDTDAINGLPLLLTHDASTWWNGVKAQAKTWEKTLNLIRAEFSPLKEPHQIYVEIFSEKQAENMPTDSFICSKRALLAQLPEKRHDETSEMDLIYGLLHLKIREKVTRNEVKTFDELLSKARHIEALENETQTDNVTELQESYLRTGAKKKIRCTFCQLRGHTFENCRRRVRKEKLEKMKPNTNTANKVVQSEDTNTSKLSCYGCGKIGFYRSNCPDCKNKKTESPSQAKFYSIDTALKLGKSPPTVHVQIAGIDGLAHLDTAARTSIAGHSLYKHLKEQGMHFKPLLTDITLADGTTKQEEALITTVDIIIGYRKLLINLLVLPTAKDNRTLLGMDFLEDAAIILNLPQRVWSFANEPEKCFCFLSDDTNMIYTSISSLTSENVNQEIKRQMKKENKSPFLEWYSECDTSPKENVNKDEKDPVWRLIPLQTPPRKRVLPGEKDESDYSPGKIQAIFRDSIPANMITPPRDPRRQYGLMTRRSRVDLNSIDVSLRANEATNLQKGERHVLNKFLESYIDIFENNKEATPYIQHFIKLTNTDPIATPPYRLSPLKRDQLRTELDKMLTDDIIEECESPWASPVVLVPKKDGSIRVCLDYRQLNSITIPDRYPLPRMDDLLQAIHSTCFMSTLDLRSGYWQIDVAANDRDKTTFITPFGTFQFKRMPFGLRNAPATFQRLMDRFRSGLNSICLLIYLDDLILCSDSFEHHLSDLEKVFERLKTFKLNVNRTKCSFCCTKVKYLGHIITDKGISPDPDKVDAIISWPTPKTLKQLISFLQTCSWYRRFIPEFAKISQPLSILTKKNTAWQWGEKQSTSFGKLKELLTTAPILRQADENLPYILKTDASNYALGAVLVQGEGAEEHPIEYTSRLLTSAECNYNTTEREALAIVWAVNRYRGYLEDAQTIIVTDHQPLKWLMTMKTPSGRLARWALSLQTYNLQITYSPGKTNVVADSLSRLACSKHTNATCEVCSTHIDLPRQGADEIRKKQIEDPDLKNIIEALEDTQSNEKYLRWFNMGYILNKGILYRYTPDNDNDDGQLVVPKSEQTDILKEYHDASTAGHYGIDRTYQRIASRYYWAGMRQQIAKYVSQCVECQRYKGEHLKPAGLLQTTPSKQRFEIIAVDLFGSLSPSEDNKRWILVIEDTTSRWIELFSLQEATAETCATILLNEIFLRFGIPRRMISDNGTQFISAIMQHLTYCLGIKQSFTPVYHPASNPVERKNRDLKTQLAILVGEKHPKWPEKLSYIRFAMNTARCESTGYSAAFLTFGRDLRTPDDVSKDVRAIVKAENFIEQMTPRLLQLMDIIDESKDITRKVQIRNQKYTDKHRRPDPGYAPGSKVWVRTHTQSKATKGFTSKLAPKRDGPYIILAKKGATTYEISSPDSPTIPMGVYHTSVLSPYKGTDNSLPLPVVPIRRRGRPKKIK